MDRHRLKICEGSRKYLVSQKYIGVGGGPGNKGPSGGNGVLICDTVQYSTNTILCPKNGLLMNETLNAL